MEYQVPQFIEVEDKIVGPLTFRQFIYIAGAAGLCVLSFAFLPTIVAVLISAGAVGLAVTLAFYKVNGKSFIEMMEAAFTYFVGTKFFLWKHQDPTSTAAIPPPPVAPLPSAPRPAPRLTRGKLEELAWSLDVHRGETP